jgi:hypothetical protein
MYLNLDKPLAGFIVLLVLPALCLEGGAWSWARGLLIGFATAIVCLGLALVFGQVAVAPKWPPLGWLWAINNLLPVCLTEEAVFRGYLTGRHDSPTWRTPPRRCDRHRCGRRAVRVGSPRRRCRLRPPGDAGRRRIRRSGAYDQASTAS